VVRWFSPASSTTKTGRHDIAEILLKVALSTKNKKSNQPYAEYLTNQYSEYEGFSVLLEQLLHFFKIIPYILIFMTIGYLNPSVLCTCKCLSINI